MTPTTLSEMVSKEARSPTADRRVDLGMFWYVAASSEELKPGTVLERWVLGENLVLFRSQEGKPSALRNRCLHRHAPLSAGRVVEGQLRCGYHGWRYDGCGQVTDIPSMGKDQHGAVLRCAPAFDALERDGYVYVRISTKPAEAFEPFSMPHHDEPGWHHIRLLNRFQNTVTNCVENFVDIPHTAYVHEGIFRSPRRQRLEATVERERGTVRVTYRNETGNLGWFSWFLNGKGREIQHTDSFHMPNVTCVEYRFGSGKRFVITSQSVPVNDRETWVYTDLAYNFGFLSRLARPIVRWQGQKVIDQDIRILGLQMETLGRWGQDFDNTPADVIHVWIETIRRELEKGRDPRLLPQLRQEIEFWV